MTRLSDRQTGRTTRMLKEAILSASKERAAVYVVVPNSAEVNRCKRTLAKLCPEWETLGIKVAASSQLGNFDWDTLRLRGAHPTVRVMVDHCAIEQHYGNILEELHRYDATPKDEFEALYLGEWERETPEDVTVYAAHHPSPTTGLCECENCMPRFKPRRDRRED